MFREYVCTGRPAIAISPKGLLRKALSSGDSSRGSLSVLVTMAPRQPLAAATVTLDSVLTADCSCAYRFGTWGMEWEELLADTAYPPAEPGCLVLPEDLRHRGDRLRAAGFEPDFVPETASAILRAVVNHSVPAGIHYSGHVLESAILLIAAARGLSVRLHNSKGTPLKPWDASRLLFRAIRDDAPTIPGLIVARDEITALRVAQELGLDKEKPEKGSPTRR
jgi:hypothetical protein